MSTGFALDIEDTGPQSGTGSSRRLRRQGKVPAVIYGGGRKPRSVTVDHAKLLREMEHEAFYNSILTVTLGDVSQPVVVKDVQRHPSRRQVLHLDFQRIREDEKITLSVPIHFLGMDVAVGVKEQGGEVTVQLAEVEVNCLPKDLPEYVEIDVSGLELNQRLYLTDLQIPEGVEIPALVQEQNPSIVSINPLRREEEDEAPELEDDMEFGPMEAEGPGGLPRQGAMRPGRLQPRGHSGVIQPVSSPRSLIGTTPLTEMFESSRRLLSRQPPKFSYAALASVPAPFSNLRSKDADARWQSSVPALRRNSFELPEIARVL